MKDNNLNEKLNIAVDSLLANLKERPCLILKKRFGVEGEQPMVLGKIGEELNVTRERIRQIESDSFKKLRATAKGEEFYLFEEKALKIIESRGGFCEKKYLKQQMIKNISQKQRNQLMFLLNGSNKLKFKKGKLDMRGYWHEADDREINKLVSTAHSAVVEFIKDKKRTVAFDEILAALSQEKELAEFFAPEQGEKRLRMILMVSRIVSKNILEEWGLKNWKVISQRGAREKSYIVLKKYEKPLHFKKIADLINRHWDEKKALPQTVHNELIKDARFVLVGRGIYALKDWGFLEGTVREVICAFLEKQNNPTDKETIVTYVLDKKQVKRTTVMVTLADRKSFHKTSEGLFALK